MGLAYFLPTCSGRGSSVWLGTETLRLSHSLLRGQRLQFPWGPESISAVGFALRDLELHSFNSLRESTLIHCCLINSGFPHQVGEHANQAHPCLKKKIQFSRFLYLHETLGSKDTTSERSRFRRTGKSLPLLGLSFFIYLQKAKIR